MAVTKSVPCDFDIHLRVSADRLFDVDWVFGASSDTTVVSAIIPDDDVALEPDETYVVTLSLSVSDPHVTLESNLVTLIVKDNDCELWCLKTLQHLLCITIMANARAS